jgi:hypothetical protein
MDPADQSIKGALSKRAQKAAVTRAKNKLKAAKEKGRAKLPKMSGAVRVGRKKGKGAKPTPQRLQRLPVDQAHRDKIARQTKALPKEVRRAIATAEYGKSKPGVDERRYLTTDNPRTRSTTYEIRRELREAGTRLILGIPAFGRKKLTKAERQKEQELILQEARRLRARMALGPVQKNTKAKLPKMAGAVRVGRKKSGGQAARQNTLATTPVPTKSKASFAVIKKRARSRHRERTLRLIERLGVSSRQVLTRKRIINRQGNLLTGGIDRVAVKQLTTLRTAPSQFSKQAQRLKARMDRAWQKRSTVRNEMIDLLKTIDTSGPKKKNSPERSRLNKMQKSILTLDRAGNFYGANPRIGGRRTRSSRRRRR